MACGAVPADNPFVSRSGALPEIYAYGLRNPWRFAFDRATGDLYIGDVGQDAVEEIDAEVAPRHGGQNYGWNVMEGTRCFRPSNCSSAGLTLPVLDYPRPQGASVTGGHVYRGCRMPGYAGRSTGKECIQRPCSIGRRCLPFGGRARSWMPWIEAMRKPVTQGR